MIANSIGSVMSRDADNLARRRNLIFWGLVVLGVVLDQSTKIMVRYWIEPATPLGAPTPITIIRGFFYLVHHQNPGSAFSLFHDFGTRFPAVIGLLKAGIGGLVIYMRYKFIDEPGRVWREASFCLILGGAIGNVIDHFVPPFKVIDFLDFHFGRYRYPTFNVADIFIVVGVCLYAYWAWKFGEKKPDEKTDKTTKESK